MRRPFTLTLQFPSDVEDVARCVDGSLGFQVYFGKEADDIYNVQADRSIRAMNSVMDLTDI